MNTKWTTHKGDEWWYSSATIEAQGSTGHTFIQISVKPKQGKLTEELLINFLQETNKAFKASYEILLCLNEPLKQLMISLKNKGILNWELVQHPFSQSAKILSL